MWSRHWRDQFKREGNVGHRDIRINVVCRGLSPEVLGSMHVTTVTTANERVGLEKRWLLILSLARPTSVSSDQAGPRVAGSSTVAFSHHLDFSSIVSLHLQPSLKHQQHVAHHRAATRGLPLHHLQRHHPPDSQGRRLGL
jgi:hypothetical protein